MLQPSNLRRPVPSDWKVLFAADTGTYMSAGIILSPPGSADLFVVEEFPNYRYVGGQIELLGDSIPEWTRKVKATFALYRPGQTRIKGWCDENSQFKTELTHHGIHLRGNKRKLELRVEIAREYVQNHRVWFAPWLSVLPWEMEHAVWPDDTNSAGRFEREKENDHSLDWFEHILSRRPRNKALVQRKTKSFVAKELEQHKGWRALMRPRVDAHLGAN